MADLTISLEAGVGLAVIAGYILFKLKKIKKALRRSILRRVT